MAISRRLRWYLDKAGLDYEVLHHTRSHNSLETARHSHIPPGRLAKPVLLEDERGYVLAVIPASCRVDLEQMESWLHRHLELAGPGEIETLFPDCEPGAMPPVGEPYRLTTVYDDVLARMPDLYFEAGDHEDVVHVSRNAFLELMHDAPHAHFSRPN